MHDAFEEVLKGYEAERKRPWWQAFEAVLEASGIFIFFYSLAVMVLLVGIMNRQQMATWTISCLCGAILWALGKCISEDEKESLKLAAQRQKKLRKVLEDGKRKFGRQIERQIDWLIYCCIRKRERCSWRKTFLLMRGFGIVVGIPIIFLFLQTMLAPPSLRTEIDPSLLKAPAERFYLQTMIMVNPDMVISDIIILFRMAGAVLVLLATLIFLAKLFEPTATLRLRDDLAYLKTELNDDGTKFRTLKTEPNKEGHNDNRRNAPDAR